MQISTNWGDFDLGHINLMLVMLLLPLGAFVVQVFFSSKLPRQGDWVPTAAIGVSMLIALGLFVQTIALGDSSLLLHSGFASDAGRAGPGTGC
jgi:NADH:ubiquinone oxidoreductase subunit 5 (subunit L)/multisubunit Na+/H+ antiporter MnhA subunit